MAGVAQQPVLLAAERREQVLTILRTEGKVRAAELSTRLGVSLDTVRRDLKELADAGHLRRVHGGALPLTAPGPADFHERLEEDTTAKQAVAAAALPLVRAGDVALFGGGATLLELARRLPDDLDATVIATGPDIAAALADHPALRVEVVGGRLHPEARTVTGPEAVDALRRVRPHACFVSACTVHPVHGLTMRNADEALVMRAMVECCERVVVLATAAKLGTTGPYPIAELGAVDTLVTDAPARDAGVYRGAGLEVVRA
jgi:DeoR/GlpR family transcriptional regulator of sugar metabolism